MLKVRSYSPDVAIVDIRLPPTHQDEGLQAALEIRTRHPDVGVLVLSQYVEVGLALKLFEETADGAGYLLKDRIGDVPDFVAAVRRIAEGGSAIDPIIVSTLVSRRRDDDPLGALTPREREVLVLMAEGRSNQGIADKLVITLRAVEKYVSTIFGEAGSSLRGQRLAPRARGAALPTLLTRPAAAKTPETRPPNHRFPSFPAPSAPATLVPPLSLGRNADEVTRDSGGLGQPGDRRPRPRQGTDGAPSIVEAPRSPNGATAPVVSASELTRQYGADETAVHALRGVSVDVASGALTAVMGPSGSGKSTLMHILAGLDRPTAGDVRIADIEIGTLSDTQLTKLRREHIGFIFQFFNLLPMLTAKENIVLPLSIAGAEARRRRGSTSSRPPSA